MCLDCAGGVALRLELTGAVSRMVVSQITDRPCLSEFLCGETLPSKEESMTRIPSFFPCGVSLVDFRFISDWSDCYEIP